MLGWTVYPPYMRLSTCHSGNVALQLWAPPPPPPPPPAATTQHSSLQQTEPHICPITGVALAPGPGREGSGLDINKRFPSQLLSYLQPPAQIIVILSPVLYLPQSVQPPGGIFLGFFISQINYQMQVWSCLFKKILCSL